MFAGESADRRIVPVRRPACKRPEAFCGAARLGAGRMAYIRIADGRDRGKLALPVGRIG
jgi:hypothetical protein